MTKETTDRFAAFLEVGQRRLLKHETTPRAELDAAPRDELVAYVEWLEREHIKLSKEIASYYANAVPMEN